jgi:uncharacterized protein YegJ (DUF2314 family)
MYVAKNARRQAENPLIPVAPDDAGMNLAIDSARASVGQLLSRLNSPPPSQSYVAVKVRLTDGKHAEHVWLSPIRFDGSRIHGQISNTVEAVSGWKEGDSLSTVPDSISDWMAIDDSVLVGGFSIRLLRSRMSPDERSALDAESPYRVGPDSTPLKLNGRGHR